MGEGKRGIVFPGCFARHFFLSLLRSNFKSLLFVFRLLGDCVNAGVPSRFFNPSLLMSCFGVTNVCIYHLLGS